MTTIEKTLMRALNLKSVEELDELLARPISEDAAEHSEPPDEVYELADRLDEEADSLWNAYTALEALFEGRCLN